MYYHKQNTRRKLVWQVEWEEEERAVVMAVIPLAKWYGNGNYPQRSTRLQDLPLVRLICLDRSIGCPTCILNRLGLTRSIECCPNKDCIVPLPHQVNKELHSGINVLFLHEQNKLDTFG